MKWKATKIICQKVLNFYNVGQRPIRNEKMYNIKHVNSTMKINGCLYQTSSRSMNSSSKVWEKWLSWYNRIMSF